MDEVYGILPPLTVIQGPQDHKHWVYRDGIHLTPARIQEPGHFIVAKTQYRADMRNEAYESTYKKLNLLYIKFSKVIFSCKHNGFAQVTALTLCST